MQKNVQTTTQLHSAHKLAKYGSKFQISLQQYINCELPDVQAGCRKGRGARDQIANIRWTIKKDHGIWSRQGLYSQSSGFSSSHLWI